MSSAWHDPIIQLRIREAQDRLRAASAKIITHYADPDGQAHKGKARTGQSNKGGARGLGISFRKDGKR